MWGGCAGVGAGAVWPSRQALVCPALMHAARARRRQRTHHRHPKEAGRPREEGTAAEHDAILGISRAQQPLRGQKPQQPQQAAPAGNRGQQAHAEPRALTAVDAGSAGPAGRGRALTVVDAGGGLQGLLQPVGAVERGGPAAAPAAAAAAPRQQCHQRHQPPRASPAMLAAFGHGPCCYHSEPGRGRRATGNRWTPPVWPWVDHPGVAHELTSRACIPPSLPPGSRCTSPGWPAGNDGSNGRP